MQQKTAPLRECSKAASISVSLNALRILKMIMSEEAVKSYSGLSSCHSPKSQGVEGRSSSPRSLDADNKHYLLTFPCQQTNLFHHRGLTVEYRLVSGHARPAYLLL